MLKQRGDTIIEVLLAFTVFTAVSVAALSIMNQGSNAAQRSLEVALVKQQIDAQAEALRAAHQAQGVALANHHSSTAWSTIIGPDSSVVTVNSSNECGDFSGTSGIFAMNGRTGAPAMSAPISLSGADDTAPPYSRAVYDDIGILKGVYGLWIERKNIGGSPNAFDFTIKACWYGPGQVVPMQLQTVVRLYDYA